MISKYLTKTVSTTLQHPSTSPARNTYHSYAKRWQSSSDYRTSNQNGSDLKPLCHRFRRRAEQALNRASHSGMSQSRLPATARPNVSDLRCAIYRPQSESLFRELAETLPTLVALLRSDPSSATVTA